MFSGLVEAKCQIREIRDEGAGIRLVVQRPSQFDDVSLGDSIACSGCCLTVVEIDDQAMHFQAGEETLSKTILGKLQTGSFLNCERSLALGDRLGGHLVTGHVDGLGKVEAVENVAGENNDEWCDMTFSAPLELMRQMASKGSITVQGVSLTLVNVTDEHFSVALIPHTLAETTLGELKVGDVVNLETDLLAKYVGRQLASTLARVSPN